MHDLACVVHLHSLYSDGTGTVRQIVRAGRRAGVDVVMLTDHDTLEAKRQGHEGWHDGVLLLVGEEVSPPRRDHCLAFGIEHEIDRGLGAAAILREIRAAGGLGFAAHPFSRGSRRFKRGGDGMPFAGLESEDLHGIELWSFVTDTAETFESIRDALRFIVSPGRVLDHPPRRNLQEWDRLCRRRPVVALGGLDAHQVGKRIGPVVPFRLMAYHRSFRYLRTHVLCEQAPTGELDHDRAQVYSALRDGRCYLAMDSLAPARGFDFTAGELRMGSEAAAGRRTVRVSVPAPAHLRLLRDGDPIATVGSTTELTERIGEPGVYRAEAWLEAHGRPRTWIVSNPIYLR
ncbi:MAG TPA: CehA/McbA family metallohydrolase [Thermoleophilaceae bacterium]|nr:CehA/McbA family metallohydrolase [Thermoleophilaceae bacterium]